MKPAGKKYTLTDETKEFSGVILHRIKALRDFGDIKAGDFGGWVQSESNLSHVGACWVYFDAIVYGGVVIGDNAKVYGQNTRIGGHLYIVGDICICGEVFINGSGIIGERRPIITLL